MTNPYRISDDTPVYVISGGGGALRHAPADACAPTTGWGSSRPAVPPGAAAAGTRCATILVLREVQRLSQARCVSLPGIKRIMELEGELDRYRARSHRADRRDGAAPDRASSRPGRWPPGSAGLLRSRRAGGTLVPVRDS